MYGIVVSGQNWYTRFQRRHPHLDVALILTAAGLFVLLVCWLVYGPLEVSAAVWVGMYALIYGDPRFHHVLIPIACLLAASALTASAQESGAADAI